MREKNKTATLTKHFIFLFLVHRKGSKNVREQLSSKDNSRIKKTI